MKVVILAGGFGTRLSEETQNIPKPMVTIGNKPILWHIMKTYSYYGYNEFVILLGYKGYIIKEYFSNYFLHQSDVEIDLKNNNIDILNNTSEPWKVSLIDTGENTMTGSRIKRVQNLIGNNCFMLTYGDGIANININSLVNSHKKNNKTLTMTAVQPEGRFGSLNILDNNKISLFQEKPKGDGGWINGGFFVCEPDVFNYIDNLHNIVFENEPLKKMAVNGELYAYKHTGFWKPMDTQRDHKILNEMWNNKPIWKIWK